MSIDLSTTKELAEKYPAFADLRVYGTRDEPLFPVGQVADMLGMVQIRCDRIYELGVDYVRMIIPRRDGRTIEQNMLTEQGLYNVIFRSQTEAGRKFRIFVGLLLKDLRLRGMVRLDEIITTMKECIASTIDDDLYFITDGVWTKIGRSGDVNQRIQQLQTANPLQLSIVCTFPHCGKWEKLVHEKVAAERRGEWFKIADIEPLRKWVADTF